MVLTNGNWLYSISCGKLKMFLCVFTQFRLHGVVAVVPAFPLEKLIRTWFMAYCFNIMKKKILLGVWMFMFDTSTLAFLKGQIEALLPLAVLLLVGFFFVCSFVCFFLPHTTISCSCIILLLVLCCDCLPLYWWIYDVIMSFQVWKKLYRTEVDLVNLVQWISWAKRFGI